MKASTLELVRQGTGTAVVGSARGELSWGAGAGAGSIAGRTRHPGRLAMVLPRELDMIAAGAQMPLPVPRPKIIEAKKEDAKSRTDLATTGQALPGKQTPMPKQKIAALDIKKQDGKSKAEPAKLGESAAAKHMPVPKPKTTAVEMKKQEGKIKATSARAAEDGKAAPKSGSGKPALRERATAHCTDCSR